MKNFLCLGSDVLLAKLVATLLESNCYCLRCLSGNAVCIEVAQHGRVLERSRFKRNPASSARDSFFRAHDFVKGADGLWHPRVEADQLVVNLVWSQVANFPEVELRLLHKRDWRVVISQKWNFEDDILLREARALFRGLQVVHMDNADSRIFCDRGTGA